MTPQGDARLSVWDRFKAQSTGGKLYYGEQPPRWLAAIKQPLWAGAILLGDGWMDEWDSYEMIQTGLPTGGGGLQRISMLWKISPCQPPTLTFMYIGTFS